MIISSQIINDHMESVQYQHYLFIYYLFIYYLFIHLFIYSSIYLSIYLFDTWQQSSFSVFSKGLSPDKIPTSEPLPRGVFLTLHYHMHFINNRNEQIQAKIL